jgi:diadenylate cyclase
MDVAQVLQRSEMVRRIADEITLYVSELGSDGRLIDLQLDELMRGVIEEEESVIRDYSPDTQGEGRAQRALAALDEDGLMQPMNVAQALGYPLGHPGFDRALAPRGYRMLRRVPRLPANVVDNLVARFRSLQNMLHATKGQLDEVEGVGPARAQAIYDGLHRISEALIIDRYM